MLKHIKANPCSPCSQVDNHRATIIGLGGIPVLKLAPVLPEPVYSVPI